MPDAEEDGDGGEGEEPEGDEPEEEACGHADGFPDVADGDDVAGEGEEVGWEDFDGLGAEDDKGACGVSWGCVLIRIHEGVGRQKGVCK